MPPVMGAAAFLMIEYVNMPYSQLITYAAMPALMSYIALVYIVATLRSNENELTRRLPRTDPEQTASFLLKNYKQSFNYNYLSICHKIWIRLDKKCSGDFAFIICAVLALIYIVFNPPCCSIS